MNQERKVLIIAYYFPPVGLSGVQRTLKFTKYLPDYGWKPLVLTTTPTSFYAFDDTLLEELNEEKVTIYRTPPSDITRFLKGKENGVRQLPNYFKQKVLLGMSQMIFQPDTRIGWKKAALQLGRRIIQEEKPEIIFSTAPPFTDFLVAFQLAREFDLPFVVDYRDTWVDNPFHFYATPFHKQYNIGLETEILKFADKAIVTNRYAKELLLERYGFLEHNDIRVIPHGFDAEDFQVNADARPNPEKFTITHSGVFQDNRTPKYFLKALAKFLANNPRAREKVDARFIGVMRKGHAKLVKRYKLEQNVTLTGYVEHRAAVRELLESDVLWLMMKDNVRSPGKLYEYFGARKPLLASVPDGAMRTLALESNAAIVTKPDDVKAIVKSLELYFELWEKGELPRPSERFTAQFERKKLCGDLSRELGMALHF